VSLARVRGHSLHGAGSHETDGVPVACPIGRSTPGAHGHSRTARHTGSPAYGQADPLRKPTFQAGHLGRAVGYRSWAASCSHPLTTPS
jgi:hypothetical protein